MPCLVLTAPPPPLFLPRCPWHAPPIQAERRSSESAPPAPPQPQQQQQHRSLPSASEAVARQIGGSRGAAQGSSSSPAGGHGFPSGADHGQMCPGVTHPPSPPVSNTFAQQPAREAQQGGGTAFAGPQGARTGSHNNPQSTDSVGEAEELHLHPPSHFLQDDPLVSELQHRLRGSVHIQRPSPSPPLQLHPRHAAVGDGSSGAAPPPSVQQRQEGLVRNPSAMPTTTQPEQRTPCTHSQQRLQPSPDAHHPPHGTHSSSHDGGFAPPLPVVVPASPSHLREGPSSKPPPGTSSSLGDSGSRRGSGPSTHGVRDDCLSGVAGAKQQQQQGAAVRGVVGSPQSTTAALDTRDLEVCFCCSCYFSRRPRTNGIAERVKPGLLCANVSSPNVPQVAMYCGTKTRRSPWPSYEAVQ